MPKEFYIPATMDGGVWIEADSAEEAKEIADSNMSKSEWLNHLELTTFKAEGEREVKVPEWFAQQKAHVA